MKVLPYNLASIAKTKGFDLPVLAAYDRCEMLSSHSRGVFNPLNYNSKNGGDYVSAPLYQEIVDWFREKYGLWIELQLDTNAKMIDIAIYDINASQEATHVSGISTLNYYEALNKAIQEAFKLI